MVRDPNERPVTYGPLGIAARLLIAWTFVGVPLAWGVTQTVRSSIPLFTKVAPHATAPPVAAPAAVPAK